MDLLGAQVLNGANHSLSLFAFAAQLHLSTATGHFPSGGLAGTHPKGCSEKSPSLLLVPFCACQVPAFAVPGELGIRGGICTQEHSCGGTTPPLRLAAEITPPISKYSTLNLHVLQSAQIYPWREQNSGGFKVRESLIQQLQILGSWETGHLSSLVEGQSLSSPSCV